MAMILRTRLCRFSQHIGKTNQRRFITSDILKQRKAAIFRFWAMNHGPVSMLFNSPTVVKASLGKSFIKGISSYKALIDPTFNEEEFLNGVRESWPIARKVLVSGTIGEVVEIVTASFINKVIKSRHFFLEAGVTEMTNDFEEVKKATIELCTASSRDVGFSNTYGNIVVRIDFKEKFTFNHEGETVKVFDGPVTQYVSFVRNVSDDESEWRIDGIFTTSPKINY
ncbi:glycine dehydrogenase [Acrasis kona]|uniref:Glycine dehydrogenase n=1 Tax=Acrasis kona TaxID=1008807 RepID=A0AAW2YYU5_9EUKA